MTTENDHRIAPSIRRARTALLASVLCLLAAACDSGPDAAAAAAAQEAKNKELVVNFYKAIFDDRKVAEAFRKYAAPGYIQHSPLAEDVPGTIVFLQAMLDGSPAHAWSLEHAIADGDIVALHVHSWSVPEDPGRAIVDIFRVENGLVAEHWEVIQTVVKMEGRSMF